MHYREITRVVVHTSAGAPLRDFDIQVLNQSEKWWDTVRTVDYATTTTFTVTFPPRVARGVRVVAKVGPSDQPDQVRVAEIQAFAR